MTNYVAMLRGINVSGQKMIKMENLRASFESLGFSGVATYVQSGNIIFKAPAGSPALLIKRIEKQISGDFGFAVPVFLRTAGELGEIVKGNPFLKGGVIDHSKLHVTFLSGEASRAAGKSLEALAVKPEQFHVTGREVYLYCPNGYGRTKLSNTAIEKKLGVGATTRNWKSVNALLTMLNGTAAP